MKPHDDAHPSNKIYGSKSPGTTPKTKNKNHEKITTKITEITKSVNKRQEGIEMNHSYIEDIEVIYHSLPPTFGEDQMLTPFSSLMKLLPNLEVEK